MSGAARIRRGGVVRTRKRVPEKSGRRAPRTPSRAAQALATLPVKQETLNRAGNYLLGGFIAIGLAAGGIAMQLPQMIGVEIGEAIGRMGFAVRNVEVQGRTQMDRKAVIDIAMDQPSRAMPLVDLEATRQRLKQLGWVSDARVARRLPDTLVVDIIERRPTAIWQFQKRLSLIDQNGVVIAPVDIAKMPDLPLLIGPSANERVADLVALMEKAPTLKPMLAGASWVGGRRWDLRFQSGETLALPEGEQASGDALADFARRDASHRLLGQGFVRFDMRVPGRIVVRVSKEPGRNITDEAVAAAGVKTT
ncbi:MAG: cell division protein FtsQ/DivIB [Sphingomonadaceae bacterium]